MGQQVHTQHSIGLVPSASPNMGHVPTQIKQEPSCRYWIADCTASQGGGGLSPLAR